MNVLDLRLKRTLTIKAKLRTAKIMLSLTLEVGPKQCKMHWCERGRLMNHYRYCSPINMMAIYTSTAVACPLHWLRFATYITSCPRLTMPSGMINKAGTGGKLPGCLLESNSAAPCLYGKLSNIISWAEDLQLIQLRPTRSIRVITKHKNPPPHSYTLTYHN